MMAETRTVEVSDQSQLESTVSGYLAQGFVVSRESETSVSLFKKKAFDLGKFARGHLMCIVPGVLYILRYSREKDQMVVVTVSAQAG